MTALSPDDEHQSPELAPLRLIDGGAGEHERNLIASARLDRVPGAAKARVAAALGGGLEQHAAPGARASGGLEHTGRGDALPRAGTRFGFGLLGAGVVGSVALSIWLVRPGAESDSESTSPHPVWPATVSVADPAQAAPSEGVSSPRSSAAAAPVPSAAEAGPAAQVTKQEAPAGSDRSPQQRSRTRAATARALPAETGLLAEVRALEAVGEAIGAGQVDRATRELAAYRHRFARGELSIEADVLAIEIAVARGEHAAASAAAKRLLARSEARHYRDRVQALLERKPRGADARDRSNDAAAHMRARR